MDDPDFYAEALELRGRLPWPSCDDLDIILPDLALGALELGIVSRLYRQIAYDGVHTMYGRAIPLADPYIEEDRIAWVCRCSNTEFAGVRKAIERYFTIKDGRWHIGHPEWVRIAPRGRRRYVAGDARKFAEMRQGEFCVYCGAAEGPFHLDHIFPVSRGGSDDSHNLVVACQSCNGSKNDKTIQEWVAHMMSREARS